MSRVSDARGPVARARARSLAEWLRAWEDDALAELIVARPDLALPTPGDTSVLALRAGERTYVARALERLDHFALAVLDAVLLLPAPVRPADIARLAGTDTGAALERLSALALVWGTDEIAPVSGLAATLERPAGLGRPLATLIRRTERSLVVGMLAANDLPLTSDPDEAIARLIRAVPAAVARVDAAERDVLDYVDGGGGVGAIANPYASAERDDPSPVRRVLARGLLVPLDTRTVEMPREVGLALRGADWFPAVSPEPPALESAGPRRPDADSAGGQVALDAVRLVSTLLELWGTHPPAELKSGGLGQRDLRFAARTIGVDEPTAAVFIEIARAAGLIGRTTSLDAHFAPTGAYDGWSRLDPAQRWARLAAAWVDMPVDAALVGRRDDRDKVFTALGAGAVRPAVRELRRAVLGVLALAPADRTPPRADILARLEWLSPRRFGPQHADAVDRVLQEAALLGVVAADGLASYARPLSDATLDPTDALAAALANALPEPVDHILLQGDLTAVAPGLLSTELSADLALLADVESPGSATVYRFSDRSLRRALDVGWDAAEISELLTRIGKPVVPQALAYLVEDTARRHGQLRVGGGGAYVRCDDEALLAEAISDRRTADLRLRRIAPTIAVSPLGVTALLDALRAAGFAPVGERADGTVTLGRPEGTRAPRAIPMPRGEAAPDRAAARRVVASLRAGDRVSAAPGPPVQTGVATTLDLLDRAVREGRPVLLGYVNAQGQEGRRIVDPERVAGGLLTAYDHRSQERRSFALHRITELALADETGA